MPSMKIRKDSRLSSAYILSSLSSGETLKLSTSELLEVGTWVEAHKQELEQAYCPLSPDEEAIMKQRVVSVFEKNALRDRVITAVRANALQSLDEQVTIQNVLLESRSNGLAAYVRWTRSRVSAMNRDEPMSGRLRYIVLLQEQDAFTIVEPKD